MTKDPRWKISELRDRTERALSFGYNGPESRSIRAVPDERTLRYYTTKGLLDRPAEIRGRTAYYGWRHLLQTVAIKRLQEKGLSLVEIQEQLAGRPSEDLAKIARLPGQPDDEFLEERSGKADIGFEDRANFKASRKQASFWKEEPAASEEPVFDEPSPQELRSASLSGAILVWNGRPPTPEDLAALRSAAIPLLREMARRGLLGET